MGLGIIDMVESWHYFYDVELTIDGIFEFIVVFCKTWEKFVVWYFPPNVAEIQHTIITYSIFFIARVNVKL